MSLSDKTVRTWKTNGGSVLGTAFNPDGTILASTGDGELSATSFSDSVVALDPKDLHLKDQFSARQIGIHQRASRLQSGRPRSW